jgi:hypothetical protein
MPELWLVCEGGKGSLDVAIFKPIFTTILAAGITVEPAGGTTQLSTVARFLQLQRGGTAAYLSDRDYRPRNNAENSIRDGSPGFLLRRHSIENYLLPPRVVVSSIEELQRRSAEQLGSRASQWLTDLSTDTQSVTDTLRECAVNRAAKEACLLAAHRFWDSLPPSVQLVQKRTPQTPTVNDLTDPAPWRESLCQEIERIRVDAQSASQSPLLHRANVLPFFDQAYAEVTAAQYMTEMEFLVDFHGRELLRELYRRLLPQGTRLSFDRLCGELTSAAVNEYDKDRGVYGSDDFLDLANGVRSLAALPPLP